MLARTVLAATAATLLVSATAASADTLTADPAAAPAPAIEPCPESALTVRATPSGREHVVRLSVRNDSAHTCLVDRVPLVTYGDLDGAALPFPLSGDAAYKLDPGKSAHAVVRSLSPSGDSDARSVGYVVVAANPEHHGRKFTAASLDEPGGLRVWEPVTTLWQPTRALADEVMAEADGGGVLWV